MEFLQWAGKILSGFIKYFKERYVRLEAKELEFLNLLLEQPHKRVYFLSVNDINRQLDISTREYNLMTSRLIDLELIWVQPDYCGLTSKGGRVLRRQIK